MGGRLHLSVRSGAGRPTASAVASFLCHGGKSTLRRFIWEKYSDLPSSGRSACCCWQFSSSSGPYGLAVILFALLVKLVILPLTIKSKKSMIKMNALNAELQQLQKKYANNRVKLNEEMQKLYERHGVSPMSGCLPQFIPLPVMFGLYYAVQQPLKFMLGFGDETLTKLAELVGVDPNTLNYTGQIQIADKLGQIYAGKRQYLAGRCHLDHKRQRRAAPTSTLPSSA